MRIVEGSTGDDVVPHVGNTKSVGGEIPLAANIRSEN